MFKPDIKKRRLTNSTYPAIYSRGTKTNRISTENNLTKNSAQPPIMCEFGTVENNPVHHEIDGVLKNVVYLPTSNAEALMLEYYDEDHTKDSYISEQNLQEHSKNEIGSEESNITITPEPCDEHDFEDKYFTIEDGPKQCFQERIFGGSSFTSALTSSTANNSRILGTVQTQTPKSFLLETPQRIKYSAKIRKLQLRVRKLEKTVEEIGGQIDESEDDYEEIFEYLCDKYLTPSMSKFVKIQARQGQSGTNYDNEIGDIFVMYGS